ncbi:MAG TPA: gamma-glutamylcyclotransferase [Actinobacteria bacterium]|nr:gamma-glutamylcyclotransferase [Actinomycetota bacterium]
MLYFAYTARIAPAQMAEVAPGAEFRFIAHLPQWTITFPIYDEEWNGGLPSVEPADGQTVWGAVFEIPDVELEALHAAEAAEQRVPVTTEAMDRMGKRHEVLLHRHDGSGDGEYAPSGPYLGLMVAGSRHWELPIGWIAGLEEHLATAK